MAVTIEAVSVEHYESGFAIFHPTPRISWRFGSTDETGWKQISYDIRLDGNGNQEVYHVNSGESVLVPWPGKPLGSRDIVRVSVRSNGTSSSTGWTAPLVLEAALLDRSDWQANLISRSPQVVDAPKSPFIVRKTFHIARAVSSARIYATAHGLYELVLNGSVVGDQVLTPGWQSYKHHLNFQVYDVTSLLCEGRNTLCAHVGEGWFAGKLGGRFGKRNYFGNRLGFLGQLEVDGMVELVTDDTWEWYDSPIQVSEIYNGESIDSCRNTAGLFLDCPALAKVELLDFPSAKLISSETPPTKRIKQIHAIQLITTPSGMQVLDFGQNLVGWLRLNRQVDGEGEVVIRHAEVLEHGEMGMRPLRTANCTDRIRLGGNVRGWEPKFTFHGFRYAEVDGMDVRIDDFTAIVVTSVMRQTGQFHSSHKMLNQLHQNVIWSMLGNFLSIPTDCPQRDERLGWTGDLQVFAPTANYLYDTAGFIGSWMRDLAAEQLLDYDGIVPTVVPFCGDPRPIPRAHGIWADCCAITPYDLYTAFGDVDILKRQFQSMRAWLDKGLPRGPDGLWDPDAPNFGDWLDPRAPPALPAHGQTDTHLAINAYMVYTTGLVSRIAEIIGDRGAAAKYAEDYTRALKLFRDEYVSPNGRLVSDTQTAIALALKFDLLELDQRPRAISRLDWLTRYGFFKISTGFAGTPIILDVLADNDLLNLAYRCLQEKGNPSWLYPVSMGATTIWERWDSMLPDGSINPGQMTSFNHFSLGSVAAFLHSVVGGLSPASPGWRIARFRPRPGGTVTSAKTSFSSPYGLYAIEWELRDEKLRVDVRVPPNGEGWVILPGIDDKIGSGRKTYTVDWRRDPDWPPKGNPGPQSKQLPEDEWEA